MQGAAGQGASTPQTAGSWARMPSQTLGDAMLTAISGIVPPTPMMRKARPFMLVKEPAGPAIASIPPCHANPEQKLSGHTNCIRIPHDGPSAVDALSPDVGYASLRQNLIGA